MGFDFGPDELGRAVDVPERDKLISDKYCEILGTRQPVKTVALAASAEEIIVVDLRDLLTKIGDIKVLDHDVETEERGEKGAFFFDGKTDLESLAAQQGVSAVNEFDTLLGDFWPENESADQFIASVRGWRREGEHRGDS